MYNYNPSKIAPCELPIVDRARRLDGRLWNIWDAQSFCATLCSLPEESLSEFTSEERDAIAAVANGSVWPVPERQYTREDWKRDRTFHAAPGQEVSEEIYNERYNDLPPLSLPRCKRTEEYQAGYMVSEPVSVEPGTYKDVYAALGKKAGKYYYIGLLPRRPAE